VDSNSPCKGLLFPRGPYLAQKPVYLVGTVLNLHVKEISFSYERMGIKTRFEKEANGFFFGNGLYQSYI